MRSQGPLPGGAGLVPHRGGNRILQGGRRGLVPCGAGQPLVCDRQRVVPRSQALGHLWKRSELTSSAEIEANERFIAGAQLLAVIPSFLHHSLVDLSQRRTSVPLGGAPSGAAPSSFRRLLSRVDLWGAHPRRIPAAAPRIPSHFASAEIVIQSGTASGAFLGIPKCVPPNKRRLGLPSGRPSSGEKTV